MRLSSLLLAVVVALAGVAVAPAAVAAPSCQTAASASYPIERVAGADRFSTAACSSEVAYPDGASTALLARGDVPGGFADALAGAVLAHALGGPLLLTLPGSLPEATRAELVRLGAEEVVVLGGSNAVSEAVVREVQSLGAEVERVAGENRYATAAAVTARAGASGTAFVVNGWRPADALIAAAPAARMGAGLLLVSPDGVPAETASALASFDSAVVVGGYGVVGEAVEQQLRQITGSEVRRVSGTTRAATATAAARAFSPEGIRFLVSGADRSLVDAVTAGWLAARQVGPVLYVERDQPGAITDRWLRVGGLDGVPTVWLIGGQAVLSGALVSALEARYAEASAGGLPPQIRGLWVHLFDPSLKSRRGIHTVLDAAVNAQLNTIVVEVSRRQDSYYTSAVLPRTIDPQMPADLDLLATLIPAARDRGVQVHAWVPVLPAYHSEYDGRDLGPSHVWAAHGPGSADPWVTRNSSGVWGEYLDPGVPAVQDHAARVFVELATSYDLDAVHTDYLRYAGRDWGYHPTTVGRFQRLWQTTAVPSPTDDEWSKWRRRQTEDLARRIYLDVYEANPQVAVSMAASTMGQAPSATYPYDQTRTYSDVFQDWPYWLTQGIVDQAYPMNYFRESTHATWFDEWVAFERRIGDGRHLAVGVAGYLNSVPQSLSQIQRAAGAREGIVIFGYQQNAAAPADPKALLAALPGTFADPAPAPTMPWRTNPTTGHIRVLAQDGALVTATPLAGGADRSIPADASGRAGLVHLAPGVWSVSSPGYAPATVVVEAGKVAEVWLQPAG